MTTESLFMGIESVGARWRYGVLSDGSGKILSATKRKGGITLNTTPTRDLLPRISEVVSDLVRHSDRPLSETELRHLNLCVGLTGVSTKYDSEVRLPKVLSQVPWVSETKGTIFCVGDAEIIFVGSSQNVSGVALLCNAGSVSAEFDNGLVRRRGGGGPAMGDNGSGYWIGREALLRVLAWHNNSDSNGKKEDPACKLLWATVDSWLCSPMNESVKFTGATPVWDQVTAEWRDIRRQFLDSYPKDELPSAILPFCYKVLEDLGVSKWWSLVSSLAIPLISLWEKDVLSGTLGPATEIVEEAFGHLASLLPQQNGASQVLVLSGGLFNHEEKFSDSFVEKLNKDGKQFEVVTVRSSNTLRPVIGALLLAIGDSSVATQANALYELKLPEQEIVERIRQCASHPRYRSLLENE